MKAQELRIGNLIQTDYAGILEVININSEGFGYVDVRIPTFKAIGRHELKYCQPIPLTEDWLIKLGFYEAQWGYYSFGELVINVDGHVYFGETETWIAEIHFVHQLQNLYFALTNEELICQP
jgi:hypothetical protein